LSPILLRTIRQRQRSSANRPLPPDTVARSKGQSYFTLVYDLSDGPHYGRILWIKEGHDAAVLREFLDALSQECAAGIEAVAIDMGVAYIAALKAGLPSAAIVFDRFHVMQMFTKVIRDCRRAEFKAATTLGDLTGQQAIKGSLYLLLTNRDSLKETDQSRLDLLLAQNAPLNTIYTLKEQLQQLWQHRVHRRWPCAWMTGVAWPRQRRSTACTSS